MPAGVQPALCGGAGQRRGAGRGAGDGPALGGRGGAASPERRAGEGERGQERTRRWGGHLSEGPPGSQPDRGTERVVAFGRDKWAEGAALEPDGEADRARGGVCTRQGARLQRRRCERAIALPVTSPGAPQVEEALRVNALRLQWAAQRQRVRPLRVGCDDGTDGAPRAAGPTRGPRPRRDASHGPPAALRDDGPAEPPRSRFRRAPRACSLTPARSHVACRSSRPWARCWRTCCARPSASSGRWGASLRSGSNAPVCCCLKHAALNKGADGASAHDARQQESCRCLRAPLRSSTPGGAAPGRNAQGRAGGQGQASG